MKKKLFISALVFLTLTMPSLGQEAAPFALKHYGNFQHMMHMKKTDGVVDLKQATHATHTYGVGAPAHGTGEITVVDGKLWLDYGADGLGNAKHEIAPNEQAVLLVTAEVKKWRDVTIPSDMSAAKLYEFILTQAGSNGLDTKAPFPFLLEGNYFDLDWHVLNGLMPKNAHTGPLAKIKRWFMGLIGKAGGHKGVFKKTKEHQADNAGKIVGFYSAASQGVYTHPGESWHLHLVIEKDGKARHIDAVSVRKGAVLKLPVS